MIKNNHIIIKNRLTMTEEELLHWNKNWKNFRPYEIDSRDFSIKKYIPSLDGIQNMREEYKKPLKINSAWRTPNHNKTIGGKKNSDHTWIEGRDINSSAFDVHINSIQEGRELEELAIKHGFNAIGRYRRSMFIHISMRTPKLCGKIYQWGYW